jgi:NAD(P)-dependent dehydrogenase (short-subunit alcohol dehydrogenase family)
VNAVAPGVVDTEMVRQVRHEPGAPVPTNEAEAIEAQLDFLRGLHPLGRLGSPEDVAAAVLYLLDAPWVTGSVLTVDGGLTAL